MESHLTRAIRNRLEQDLERIHESGANLASAGFDAHEPEAPRDIGLRWSFSEILGESGDPQKP
jgi:hypothetical protein